jgi:hypothetical protein
MAEINYFNFLHFYWGDVVHLRWIARISRELIEPDSFI